MFQQVHYANQFNSYIQHKQFDKALTLVLNGNIQFSYIDSNSCSCFDSIFNATFKHFSVHGMKLPDKDIALLEKMIIPLLDKEPHYWHKQCFNMQHHVYYFFNFFLQNNNVDKVKFFNEHIKKFTNIEIEQLYMCYRPVTHEMGELIRNSTENSKITIQEISLAYEGFHYHNNDNHSFISYLDDLIVHKKERKIQYHHGDLVNFCLQLCKDPQFNIIFPKLVDLYTPELFKPHKSKADINENFPLLSKRIDFLAARIFSCMNFDRVVEGNKEWAISKSLTLPLLSYLQNLHFKDNINDYLIGEFRYKFVPIALEFIIPTNKTDWPSDIGLSKEEGFTISSQYFTNFFVHLLADSLVANSTFSTQEEKINRLKEYKNLYPVQFKKDLLQFEEGLHELGLKQALNADINNIRLYFKMIMAEENNQQNVHNTTVKSKKNKI